MVKVDWTGSPGGEAPAVEACRAGLAALGVYELPAGDAHAADVRVVVLAGDENPQVLAFDVQRDDRPVLLLAATDAAEAAAQQVARVQDDVARANDAPVSLLQRLKRLQQRGRDRAASRHAVERDPLTGALNRSGFNRHAQALLETMAPEAVAGVFLLDLDHFKRINDRQGHAVGDQVLVAVAGCLAAFEDVAPLCRYGGEEFCWIALQPDAAGLEALASRVLKALRGLDIAVEGGGTVHVTASIGWTQLVRGMSLQEALHEADNALYDAKAKGRDRAQSWAALNEQAATTGADVQLVHFQNVARVVNERATHLVTMFGQGLVEKARLAADQDRLTALWNRGYFDRRLAREIGLSKRDGRPLTLVMMDLDHFGQFNKSHGLPTGDAVLRRFAAVATSCIRSVDWLARYGGEEFALVLPGTLEEATTVAERIREAVQAAEIDTPQGQTVRVTVSIGIAGLGPTTAGAVGLVQHASDALQRAKRDGRNRVAA